MRACRPSVDVGSESGYSADMVFQHPLHEGTIPTRRRERAAVLSDRDDAVRVHSLEPHRYLRGGGFEHPGQKERGIPVGDDKARIVTQGRDQPAPCALCVLDVRVVEKPTAGECGRIGSHAVENEAMQPIAGPRVVAPEGLEDDEGPLQLGGDLDGALQAEIGPRPPCRRHPIEHEGS